MRPSCVWHYEGGDRNGLVVGFTNDGIAGVPGVLHVWVANDDGSLRVGGTCHQALEEDGSLRVRRTSGLG